MNATPEHTNEIELSGVVLPAEREKKSSRKRPGADDDSYIREFIKNPHLGKKHAYVAATGDDSPHCRQRANKLHLRLEDQINTALRQRVLSCTHFGMSVLFELAANATAENVRAAAASKLIELGLKVAPPEVKRLDARSREQILEDIQQTQARLKTLGQGAIVT